MPGKAVLDLGHQFGDAGPHLAPNLADLPGVAVDDESADRQRQHNQKGQQGMNPEQDTPHGDGNDGGHDQFGHAVGDEVLQRFDVVDGTYDQGAGALAVVEAVRELLKVAIDARHQIGGDAVGGHMGELAVEIAADAAKHIDNSQHGGHCQQAGGGAAALGDPLDQAAHQQGRNKGRRGEEQAAEDGEGHHFALAAQDMPEAGQETLLRVVCEHNFDRVPDFWQRLVPGVGRSH